MPQKKALIAMSGGVDSSVAAYLTQQAGFDCIGVTMRLYDNLPDEGCDSRTCCSLEDVEDARSVARRLGMPFYAFNFKEDFREKVIEKFIHCYECGLTPNPCIECNRHLKFDHLLRRGMELGCDCVVTGHYAQIKQDEQTGRYILYKAADFSKDQSYVLYSLTQEQLAHTLFPLGDMEKSAVRELAEKNGLINADKPDSQDICFVPNGDYVKVIEEYTSKTYPKGNFVDTSGNVLGQHQGIIRYTVGQRKGLGVALGKPAYVGSKNVETNEVTLCSDEELYSKSVLAKDFNWVAFPTADETFCCKARIRYRHVEQPATVFVYDGTVRITFDEPQRAATSGQSVVLYDGDTVLGGGIII